VKDPDETVTFFIQKGERRPENYGDRTVKDPDERLTFFIPKGERPAERPWVEDEFTADEEQPIINRAVAFASLGFIVAALRRGALLWCATALVGLLLGFGFFAKFPPAYKASSAVLLTNSPAEDPADQSTTNAALAQSQVVAGRVVRQLGLHQTVASFITSYTVTPTTVQVLTFTVGASSSSEAVQRAAALATVFLQYRAQTLEAQEQEQITALNQQVNSSQQQLDSVNAQISKASAQPVSPAQRDHLAKLQAQETYAQNQLTTAQGNASATLATTREYTAAMIQESQVLNAGTPIPRSLKKGLALYLAVGLIGGLVIGMGIIMTRALVSDRVRYRVDVADAIGGPVRLSVGRLIGTALRRVVTHLDHVLPVNSRGLAVVAVDNARVVGQAVVSLAVSHARQGKQVVMADLSDTLGAARLLRVSKPGVHKVRTDDVDLIVVVPDRDDVAPIGPIRGRTSKAELMPVYPAVADSYPAGDLLLTMATLDPAYGGDHLATWATDAVAMVTAGHSSAVRVHAVGEMIRLAGVRLASVVLLGVDKSDESVGVRPDEDELAPGRPF
jgi:capsular polysaccharide biosynthesis protein